MKKTINIFSIAALVAMGAVMAGCAKVESTETLENQKNDKIVTLTTTVGFAETKALEIDYTVKTLTKTFAVGDQIAVIYENENGTTSKSESVALTAGNITNEGKSATFTVTLDHPMEDCTVKYIYPAAMAGETDVDYSKLNEQDGTLATISSSYDLATCTGTLTETKELPASASLENQLAIIAYTLKDADGTNDLTSTITGMTVSDGTNTYTVTRSAAAGPIYVAIQPTSGADITYTATDGTKTYTKSVTGKDYAANNFYQLRLKLTEYYLASVTTADIGKVIGADGKLYDNKTAAEAANTTASAIVAYVGIAGSVEKGTGYKGLALALTDAQDSQWYTENSGTCLSQSRSIDTALGDDYMDGLAFTNKLVAGCDNGTHEHAAARAAREYEQSRPSGVSEWFLPSIGQWNKIVQGLSGVSTNLSSSNNASLKGVGGSTFGTKLTRVEGNALSSSQYWSSTERSDGNAWLYSAYGGNAVYDSNKTDTRYVRAAFAF